MFGDWTEKYEHIISLGKELAPLDDADRVDDNLIKGCQSRVWLAAKKGDQGHVVFHADSDAIITKGLAADGAGVERRACGDIAKADLTFLDDIGLHSHLSPTGATGFRPWSSR